MLVPPVWRSAWDGARDAEPWLRVGWGPAAVLALLETCTPLQTPSPLFTGCPGFSLFVCSVLQTLHFFGLWGRFVEQEWEAKAGGFVPCVAFQLLLGSCA